MTNQPIDVLISMKIVVAIMIIIIIIMSPYLYTPVICGICKPINVIYKPVLLTPEYQQKPQKLRFQFLSLSADDWMNKARQGLTASPLTDLYM
jgi:hypothetical protein